MKPIATVSQISASNTAAAAYYEPVMLTRIWDPRPRPRTWILALKIKDYHHWNEARNPAAPGRRAPMGRGHLNLRKINGE